MLHVTAEQAHAIMYTPEILGTALRRMREEQGLMQLDVAAMLGLAPSTIRDLETGKVKSIDKIQRYAAALNKTVTFQIS